ncbi:MAG: hypothetical protein ACJAZO_003506 [Myxococcota bacterium]
MDVQLLLVADVHQSVGAAPTFGQTATTAAAPQLGDRVTAGAANIDGVGGGDVEDSWSRALDGRLVGVWLHTVGFAKTGTRPLALGTDGLFGGAAHKEDCGHE